MKIQLSRSYLLLALFLFVVEVLIALYVHDEFIRPYFGDFLVVILIYAFVRGLFRFPTGPLLLAVFLFACGIETAQYFNLVTRLGLQDSNLAQTVLGTSFSWNDIVAYFLGCLATLAVEWGRKRSLERPSA